jgi:hypothetical protein
MATLLSPAFHTPATFAQDGTGIEVNEARDCTNGMLLNIRLDETIGDNEALFIGWAYAHPVLGMGANGVALTVADVEGDIILAHPGLEPDTSTIFFVMVITEGLVDTLGQTDLPGLLEGLSDPEAMSPEASFALLEIFNQLETTPLAGEELQVEDCQLEEEPTTSTLDVDQEALQQFFEDSGLMDEDGSLEIE